ncbi:phytoene desaturase family protein, partial [Romboutsia sp.]|uniref:phytoene desaturase family protein n=1 Tax=Romboutsia sp. TaxID=1965302 RepID=UPI003F3117A9
MNYDVIVVGGGSAGLTAAAYLSKASKKVLLCEKEDKVGGLVNSFEYKGFTFDGGIRAIEDSGVIKPMVRQLGIDIEFLENVVSLGIGEEVIKVKSKENLEDYKKLLSNAFPYNIEEINNIIEEIKKIMEYMDILYGIEHPLFVDYKEDKEYLLKTIVPWFLKLLGKIHKINKLNLPVEEYLKTFTNNQALIDMIAQSFFTNTPSFFALSYFSLYLDYRYPKGGTGVFMHKLQDFIIENKGEIKKNTEICNIDLKNKKVRDKEGNEYSYKKLIWANDLIKLYNIVDLNSIYDNRVIKKINKKKKELVDKRGSNSILSVYIT